MTTEVRCDCCDLPLSMCGKSLELAQLKERKALEHRALQERGVRRAAYPGFCPGCKTAFRPGEPVRHTDDGWWPVLCCERNVS